VLIAKNTSNLGRVPPAGRPVPRASLGQAAPGYEVLAIDPDLSQGAAAG